MNHRNLLASLGLTQEQISARKRGIGGSDAHTILYGTPAQLEELRLQKLGLASGPDFSEVLAVQMGHFTEPLNAAWFEFQTGGKVDKRNSLAEHPSLPYLRANLDGVCTMPFEGRRKRVWEAKHIGAFVGLEEAWQRYVPQLTHNCLCAGLSHASLSIIRGNGDYHLLEYRLDEAYAARYLELAAAFWECVQNGWTIEHPAPEMPPPPEPVGQRSYDMAGNNYWAHYADIYLQTKRATELHAMAKDELKEQMPPDASRAFGHGIELRKSKNGAIRIYEQGETND
jgi:predicted phage-related endonuclease